MKKLMREYLVDISIDRAGANYSHLLLKRAYDAHGQERVSEFLRLWFAMYGPNAKPHTTTTR